MKSGYLRSILRPAPVAGLVALSWLAGASAARGEISLAVIDAVRHVPPGQTGNVTVAIQNLGDDPVYLSQVSTNVPPDFAGPDLMDDFLNSAPHLLLPGAGWQGSLLRLATAPGAPSDAQSFGLTLVGGAHPYDTADLGTAYFVVDPNPPASLGVITPGPAPGCITPGNACVEIPVSIARTTTEDLRGFSVTIQLSPNLALCGDGFVEGSYLDPLGGGGGTTTFFVTGSNPYTVDGVINGLPCGATAADGVLFRLHVSSATPSGTGTITVTDALLRDCANTPLPATAGLPLAIPIDNSAPAALSDLVAVQKKTGNDTDGTTKIRLDFTSPGGTVQVYRRGFGGYPEYNDDPLAGAPAPPVGYPPAGWTLTGVSAGGQYDEPPGRDFWYYVAYVIDACGNVSAASNLTTGTLDYHLGDVVPEGIGTPANTVNTADVSLLGASYGAAGLPFGDPRNILDVGPTTNGSVDGRPLTDNQVQFEDLILFAINYAQVSKPGARSLPAAAVNRVEMALPARLPGVGETFEAVVSCSAAGDIQGLSLGLGYDAAQVEPVAVAAGELLARQSAEALLLSPTPGALDVALLGAGQALRGQGELARVTFRVLGPGDPRVGLARAEARDTGNRPVSLGLGAPGPGPTVPGRMFLGVNYPNPFSAETTIPFGVEMPGHATLHVFDVSGRLVRTLLDGVLPAGERSLAWDGRDDAGQGVASGFYVLRLSTPAGSLSRTVKVLR